MCHNRFSFVLTYSSAFKFHLCINKYDITRPEAGSRTNSRKGVYMQYTSKNREWSPQYRYNEPNTAKNVYRTSLVYVATIHKR
jgi:hypothetical protein